MMYYTTKWCSMWAGFFQILYYSDIGRQKWRRVAGTVCWSHNAPQELTVIVQTTTASTTARIICPVGMEVQDGQRRYRLNIFDKITALQHILSLYSVRLYGMMTSGQNICFWIKYTDNISYEKYRITTERVYILWYQQNII